MPGNEATVFQIGFLRDPTEDPMFNAKHSKETATTLLSLSDSPFPPELNSVRILM